MRAKRERWTVALKDSLETDEGVLYFDGGGFTDVNSFKTHQLCTLDGCGFSQINDVSDLRGPLPCLHEPPCTGKELLQGDLDWLLIFVSKQTFFLQIGHQQSMPLT